MNISFEFIEENCKTIGDLQRLEEQLSKFNKEEKWKTTN